MVDLVGIVLDARFRVESLVGDARVGGHVYRACDVENGTPYAVRTLGGEITEEGLLAWEREAALLSRVAEETADAERLVAHGVARGVAYCVFEWLEGESLEAHLAASGGHARSIGDAITILEPAARALATAHAIGVTHGDIRPATLWLAFSDGRTRMKVTQFTLASRLGGEDPSFAAPYGAPEHFKRSYGPIAPPTDAYALALTFMEVVAGRRVMTSDDPAELYLAVSDIKKRPSLRAMGVQVSDAVEAVLETALAVDPKRRYPDVPAFWAALARALPELTPAVPSVGARSEIVAALPDRSGRTAWILVAIVAAAASAVVAAKILRGAP